MIFFDRDGLAPVFTEILPSPDKENHARSAQNHADDTLNRVHWSEVKEVEQRQTRKQKRDDNREHETQPLQQMRLGFLLYADRRYDQIHNKEDPKCIDNPDENSEVHGDKQIAEFESHSCMNWRIRFVLAFTQGGGAVITVFGASGKVGGTATREIRQRGFPARAVIRDPAKAERLAALGCEIAMADLRDVKAVKTALEDATSALVICPITPKAQDPLTERYLTIDTIGEAIEEVKPRHIVAISDYGAHQPAGTGIALIFHRLEDRLRST
jgi:NAD(P)H-binding